MKVELETWIVNITWKQEHHSVFDQTKTNVKINSHVLEMDELIIINGNSDNIR